MGVDVVDLIMQDHREVERLFDELKRHPERRPLLVPVLAAMLTAHSRAEESEVYPVAKDDADEAEEIAHSQAEHVQAEQLLLKLTETDPEAPEFDKVLAELVDAVTHHVEEEETTVLPQMRARLDEDRRMQLGKAFAASRARHLGDRPGSATKEELRFQARNAGVASAGSMNKDELTAEMRKL
ncbi:hemerythrin domain-containing protein [Allokutzneria sp. A3M-2-11 16]|uniref:hemerythrin domain-containing protein n=1 Tax=Allokutzneria sp. A3M-2-11 16 TaxID=2962043 RepID=UPI0020B7CC2E|nr:hemerythrin domain-containing protein [Allokutzneria sp. A3M-2-11 16]MCP3798392.1 hemerythrin domain-containing protein [Allokutzneria sp. A3M-2-11 16]